jgi:signal transduction histidine kinase
LPKTDANRAEIARLTARISTLEQLVEVYERSVLEQSDKLYAEQERIRFQNTLLECQGEASLDGILSVSADGSILFANRRFSEMWRVPAPVVGSKSWEQVARSMGERAADPGEFREGSDPLEAGQERQDEVSLRDGRIFDRYTAPIRSGDGRIFGRVWHFRDISAFKEIGRMKDEFVSAVSHDLRTPITSIRGSLDLMANEVAGELPPHALELTRIAQENCERLVRLIDDVLDIQKMEAGRMELHLEPLELESLVVQAVRSIRPYGDRLEVGFEIESSAPGARVRADPDRVIQVMENLLSNAAKFSPAGSAVRVALARGDGTLRVSVRDQGPGIPPEFQSRVFERFTQAPLSSSRRRGGTGLGLSIARAIVERMGGTIGFSSKRGAGATFYFDLPEWSAPQEPEAAA